MTEDALAETSCENLCARLVRYGPGGTRGYAGKADETERLRAEVLVRRGVTVVGDSRTEFISRRPCARESMAGLSSLCQTRNAEKPCLRNERRGTRRFCEQRVICEQRVTGRNLR